MSGWYGVPASQTNRWNIQRDLPNGEVELNTTPTGEVRSFGSAEIAESCARYLNTYERQDLE